MVLQVEYPLSYLSSLLAIIKPIIINPNTPNTTKSSVTVVDGDVIACEIAPNASSIVTP